MNLLEIYKKKNKNKGWFINHSSLGEGENGNMFEYIGTNSRRQESFTHQFLKFVEIENKPREAWPRQKDHGQEIHKQYVVNMLQSKLFKKDKNNLYSRTAKGSLYSDFINSDIKEQERWLLNYLFLSNGYYLNRKNYIIHRVKEDLLGYFLVIDEISEKLLTNEAIKLIKLVDESFSEILRSKFFYFHSFYNDSDFLISYLRAPEAEKEELARYIEENIKTENFTCCISQKYKPGGNFNKNMLIDETRTFLLTLLFIQSKNINSSNIASLFIEKFDENITALDKEELSAYLISNKNIFEPIFEEVLELDDEGLDIPQRDDLIGEIQISEADRPEDYIDETSEVGRQKIKSIYIIKKKQARMQSNYKCALETINNCRPIYFTARANNKNYLELHHLIPKEFRNDFSYSLEVLANYITLCPRCHRQIHLAVDRERQHLINALFEERKNRLDTVGLGIDLENMYEYYKIDN